jgi:hypothetical protein
MPQATQSGAPYFRPQAQTSATLPPQRQQQIGGPGLDIGDLLDIRGKMIQAKVKAVEEASKGVGEGDSDSGPEPGEVGKLDNWQKKD